MRKLTGSQWTLLFIIAAMLAVVGVIVRLEFFASKLMPLFVIGSVVVLAILALIVEGRTSTAHQAAGQAGDAGRAGGARLSDEDKTIFVMGGWILGLAILIYLLGFMIASFVFVGAYMKWHGSKWLPSIVGSAIFTGVVFLIFNVALQVDLYRGLLFE